MRRLGPLAERNFTLLFLARSASLLGSAIAPIALAFAVLDELDGSPTDLGLVLAAASVPQIAFLLVGGVWADRLRRNRLLVATDLVMFGAQAVLAALLLAGTVELWHVIALQAVRGSAQAFFFPASTGIVPQVVSETRLQQANALLRLSLSASSVLGAAAGGALVVLFGPAWALAFDAATFLVSAALIWEIDVAHDATLPVRNFLGELREGWQEFSSRTWLWVIVVAATLGNMVSNGSFAVLGPVVADRSLGGAGAWGLILAGFGAGFVAGGLVMLRVQPERPLLVACAALLLTVPTFPLLALEAPLAVLMVGGFFSGFGIEVFSVLWDTALQQHVPRERLSRVSAYDYVGSFVAVPVGLAVVGPVADRVGTAETLWAAGAIMLTTVLAQLLVPDIRRLRRVRTPAAATTSPSP